MALTTEQQYIWSELVSSVRFSFADEIRHNPADTKFEAPGVYAVWENDKPIYIGIATLSRPSGVKIPRLWGLKSRLHSHRLGQISGSSLALAAWFCRVAPTLSHEQHKAISDRKLNPSALTESFVRTLTYSHHIVLKDLYVVESALCREIKPELNEWQQFISLDTQARRKQQAPTARFITA